MANTTVNATDQSTPLEVMTIIVPTFFYTIITTVLVAKLEIRCKNRQFLVEFASLVLPIILNLTVLAEYSRAVFVGSLLVCLTSLWYFPCKKSDEKPQTRDYITNSRSTINIISVVAILAVDFLTFPRRFRKNHTFGHSLMDVGVGLYVFSNGIVDGGRVVSFSKTIKGTIPLIIIGVGRAIVTKQINYNVSIAEYGLHWNFFITLAVTKLFVSLILSSVSPKFVWINAFLLLASHEVLLAMGLKNFVFSNEERIGFIAQNKEGIVSSVGYICIYLFSMSFSHFVDLKRGSNPKKTIYKFVILSVLSFIFSFTCETSFGISRRLANAAYCFWVLFIGIFMTGLYYISGKVLEDIHGGEVQPPLIFRSINFNGLAYFLVSNLLTGLVNVVCNTTHVSSVVSLVILIAYMLINCAVVHIMYASRIKLKL